MKLRALCALLLASTGLAMATPDIAVEGDDGAAPGWPNIDDGDLVADQQVTDFNNVLLGTGSTRTYRVRNTGNTTLTVSSTASSNAQFTISGLVNGTNILANGENEFTVRFTPTSRGLKTTTITIRSNDPDAEDPYTFELEGTGEGPEITMSGSDDNTDPFFVINDGDTTPSVATGTDFGTLAAGNTRDRFFRIKNDGDSNLHYNAPQITGADAPYFEVRSLPIGDRTISAGNAHEFQVRFSPIVAGTKTATLTMVNDDPEENPYTFRLTGNATGTPDLEVEGESGSFPLIVWHRIDDGDLDPNQDVTDFGTERLGSSEIRAFRFRNTGTDTLHISTVTSNHARFTLSTGDRDVAPGVTDQFLIVYEPTTRGTQTATITINSNAPSPRTVYTFAVTGTCEGPEIAFAGSIDGNGYTNIPDGDTRPTVNKGTDFGTISAGTNRERFFRIRNDGDAPLRFFEPEITGPGASAFEVLSLSTSPDPTIGAGNSRDFRIRFSPGIGGTKTATFRLSSDDADEDPYSFLLTGVATGQPEIKIQGNRPSEPRVEIDDGDNTPAQAGGTLFADTDAGASRTHNFRIQNDGNDRLTLGTPPVLSGANPTAFQILNFTTGPLGPGETRDFNIRFAPNNSGVKSAVFTLANNDPNEAPYNFTIQGTSLASELSVFGGAGFTEEINDGDITPREADGTDFGFVGVSGQTASRTFRIRNTGNIQMSPLAVGNLTSAFSISTNPANSVNAGGQTTFIITFNPVAPGIVSDTISIVSNDPNESPFSFRVTGTGTDSNPGLRVTGDNNTAFTNGQTTTGNANGTNMGQVNTTGDTAVQVFHVENTGTGVLNLTGVTSNNSLFTVGALSAASLNPGVSADFPVTFDPLNAGVFTATLSIASNVAGSSPFTFRVTGEGISTTPPAAPELDLFGGENLDVAIVNGDTTPRLRDGTDFQQAEAGTPVAKTFRIRNTGNAALSISSTTAPGSGTGGGITGIAGTIPAGGSDDFTLTLNRQNPGIATITVTINNNDSNESPFTFAVTIEVLAPSSVLALTNMQSSGTDLSLTFTSVPGRSYRVTASTGLSAGSWQPLQGFTGIPGDSLAQDVVLSGAIAPEISDRQFYRIEQE